MNRQTRKTSDCGCILCRCHRRKFIFRSGVRKQVFPGTAYGKYPVCRSSGTGLWTGSGLCSGADPKSVRTWKPDGISGQYVWRPDLRTGLQENAECVRNFDR